MRDGGLVRDGGGLGPIATNTLAQGDTREIGLDQFDERGLTIHRAISGEPWPGGADLELATVWAQSNGWTDGYELDRVQVRVITSSLAVRSRVVGNALRLAANASRSFTGSKVYDQGFAIALGH